MRIIQRSISFSVLATAVLLVLPALSSAATISLASGTLSYVAQAGEKDQVNLAMDMHTADFSEEVLGGTVHVAFDESSVTYTPGPGLEQCTTRLSYGGRTIACPSALVTRIDIQTGDRDDSVSAGGLCNNIYRDGFKCSSGQYAQIPAVVADLGVGNDTYSGGGGEMTKEQTQSPAEVHGGAGDDSISGTIADDKLWGDAGNDFVDGYGGADQVHGGTGKDTVSGVAQCGFAKCGTSLYVNSAKGGDVVNGDAGDDTIWGSAGPDKLYGGPGTDRFFYANDKQKDVIDGGAGKDWVKGLDFSRRSYKFTEKQVSNVEDVSDDRTPLPEFKWACSGKKCKVTKINYRPAVGVIIVFL